MTPTQAVAVRALWRVLGEEGNILAASWSRLLADVEPEDLIKLAGRFSSSLPKIYEDATELITATGHILEAEGDRLEDLGAVPARDISRNPDGKSTLGLILDDLRKEEPPDAN